MITIETLDSISACTEARAAFAKAFPDGAPSWRAVAEHPACKPDWAGWIAKNAPGLNAEEREAFGRRASA